MFNRRRGRKGLQGHARFFNLRVGLEVSDVIGNLRPHEDWKTTAGGSLAALQELLGHSSIVATPRYGRLGGAHAQAEVERIQGRMIPEVVTPALHRGS